MVEKTEELGTAGSHIAEQAAPTNPAWRLYYPTSLNPPRPGLLTREESPHRPKPQDRFPVRSTESGPSRTRFLQKSRGHSRPWLHALRPLQCLRTTQPSSLRASRAPIAAPVRKRAGGGGKCLGSSGRAGGGEWGRILSWPTEWRSRVPAGPGLLNPVSDRCYRG